MRPVLVILLTAATLAPALTGREVGIEVLEWSGIGLGLGGSTLIQKHGPLFDHPLIGGATDRPYRSETIPEIWLYGAGAGFTALTLLVPSRDGFVSRSAYENCQGLLQSLAVEELVTSLVKITVGRKRPDYDARVALGLDTLDGRLSFWSGHASVAFNLATYVSCYAWDYWSTGSARRDRFLKPALVALLVGSAGVVSWTRVRDNRHYPSDVICGAAWGAGSAWLVYRLKNRHTPGQFGFDAGPRGIGLTWRLR